MTRLQHLIRAIIGPVPRRRKQAGVRFFGGEQSRLTADWTPLYGSADRNLQQYAQELRNRSRDLERNNDYARRFLGALENNVLGADGFRLQSKVRTRRGDSTDKGAISRIEDAWEMFCEPENCSINQEDHFVDIQNLALRTVFKDGGVIARKVSDARSEFGFTVELLEYDFLDCTYTETLANGNTVFMGVEKDSSNTVVAYHIFKKNPTDILGRDRGDRVRVKAEEILSHFYVKERINQTLGVPQFCSVMYRLHFLEKYEQAELEAARGGANKGGWFQSESGTGYDGADEVETDEDGNKIVSKIMDFEPHHFEELPPDVKFIPYDPNHPNQAYGDFVKNALLGIAAGMNIDYATLTGDMTQANYSSMRSGKLEAQEQWKKLQGWMVRKFVTPIFKEFLVEGIERGIIRLPMNDLLRFCKAKWIGRRWPWVDPEKDLKASKIAIDEGLQTRTDVTAQTGGDFEENVEIMAREMEILEQNGVELPALKAAPASNLGEDVDDDEEEEEDTGNEEEEEESNDSEEDED